MLRQSITVLFQLIALSEKGKGKVILNVRHGLWIQVHSRKYRLRETIY